MLKSLSHAAEAGRAVLSFSERLRTAGLGASVFTPSAVVARYPSSCLLISWEWVCLTLEKKSSSSEEVDVVSGDRRPSSCSGRCSLM